MYRSLTADNIIIHPGSVMFRMNPQYIVAGEIVRTSRMYAMSVSPLSKNALEKISAELFEALGGRLARTSRGKEGFPAEKLKGGRDFTNRIKIGAEIFDLETIKGKKYAKLPWEKLSRIKDTPAADHRSDAAFYKGLRGTVFLDDTYTLLQGEKLSLIFTLLPSLDLDGAAERDWPRKKHFDSGSGLPELLNELPLILAPALWKTRAKGSGKKELGFLSLFTDGQGNYWFSCSRGFHTSLNESLASLESLIDELGGEVDVEIKHRVNSIYRQLSDYLN
jgi:hypothetical protein